MAANPNPVFITDAMWRLWEGIQATTPGVRLGGIYANKRGYHNTVDANKANWPLDYSIRLVYDLQPPTNKARAGDWTMSTAEMIKRTGYMKRAAEHPQDNRLNCLREFIGTLDGVNVFCMIQDKPGGPWRYDWGRDSTHLWHRHDSVFTQFVAIWDASPVKPGLEAVLSVHSGETWEAWVARKSGVGGDDVALTAIQTKDVNGDFIFLYPWNHTFSRVPKPPAGHTGIYWPLQNKLDALRFAGVLVDPSAWPGPFAMADPGVQVFLGVEVRPEGDISDAALAKVQAAAKAGAEAAMPTDAEFIEFSREGAELAEDS